MKRGNMENGKNGPVMLRTMRDVMDRAERLYRTEPALRSGRTAMSYGELIGAVRRNATRLCGTCSDKYVLLLSKFRELRADTAVSILTAMYAGRCVILLPAGSPQETVDAVMEEYGSRTLLTDGDAAAPVRLPLGLLDTDLPEKELPPVSPEDECMVLFTSGTTKRPREAVILHRNLCTCVRSGVELYPSAPGQRYLNCLPYFHGFAILCDLAAPMLGGACLCAPAGDLFSDLALYRPTHLTAVPAVVEVLLKAGGLDLLRESFGELRSVLCGGAVMPAHLREEMKKLGVSLYNCYGMTEFATAIATNGPFGDRPGSVGRLLSCVEISFSPDGEILLRGGNRMKGYGPKGPWLDRNEWFPTGDLGYMDENGYLFLSGRKDDMINLPNGEKISPEQIEAILADSAAVKESRVYRPEGKDHIAVLAVPAGRDEGVLEAVRAYNLTQTEGRRIAAVHIVRTPLERNRLGKLVRRKCND